MSHAVASPHAIRDFHALLQRSLPLKLQRDGATWTPSTIVVGLLCLVTKAPSYRQVCETMERDFGNLFAVDSLFPTAFGQARLRLAKHAGLLDEVFEAVYAAAVTARRTRSITYGDLPLFALDGTSVPLAASKRLMEAFGSPANQHGAALAPQARLELLWDVGANQPAGYALGRCHESELLLAERILARVPPGGVVIADRLYASRRFLGAVHRAGRHALVRCPTGSTAMREVQAFLASGQADTEIELTVPGADGATDEACRVRLLRGQGDQVLITTLRGPDHAAEQLVLLYAKRWRIESAFLDLKVHRNLGSIRAKTPQLVVQEVVAILIYLLLVSELDGMAIEQHAAAVEEQPVAPPAEDPPARGGHPPLVLRQNHVRFPRSFLGFCICRMIAAALSGDHPDLERRIRGALSHAWRGRTRVRSGKNRPRASTRPHSKWNRLRERP